jgi:hypothetical protein
MGPAVSALQVLSLISGAAKIEEDTGNYWELVHAAARHIFPDLYTRILNEMNAA